MRYKFKRNYYIYIFLDKHVIFIFKLFFSKRDTKILVQTKIHLIFIIKIFNRIKKYKTRLKCIKLQLIIG